jgi:hypothetical protein
MNLRIFQSREAALAVEISSPKLKSGLKWLVPLLPAGSEKIQNLEPIELVRVRYLDQDFFVPFFLIWTARVDEPRQTVVGALSPEDSINVLNNVYDRLGYD